LVGCPIVVLALFVVVLPLPEPYSNLQMPTLVSELTQFQLIWLHENQRTLSEESSASQGAASGHTAAAPMDPDHRVWGGVGMGHPRRHPMGRSIFRERNATSIVPHPHHMLPSSSPSWNANHNEPHDNGMMLTMDPATSSLELSTSDKPQQKRQRLSYQPHLLHHHRGDPYYTETAGSNLSSEDQRDDIGTDDVSSLNHTNNANGSELLGPLFPHGGSKLTWQQSYENLLMYRQHYGDCNVPQKYAGNPKLGGWVNKQRKQNKNPVKYGRMTTEHLKLLEDVDFKWE
jgi:hypothetical protein